MTRFIATTLLAIAAAIVLAMALAGPTRICALAALCATYLILCALGMACIRLQFYCPSICRGVPGEKSVALTFDDGPDPNVTPQVLDLLAREKIPAAFFCIGKQVDAHPQLAARIQAEGHLLENHTYRHPWWITCLGASGLAREMKRTQDAIQRAAGIAPRFVRSPMGLTNPHFPRALRRVGLTLVGWDVRTFDTAGPAQRAIDRIIRHARDGSIILLHDGGVPAHHILQITSAAIRELRSRGFIFQRLDHLIHQPPDPPPAPATTQ